VFDVFDVFEERWLCLKESVVCLMCLESINFDVFGSFSGVKAFDSWKSM